MPNWCYNRLEVSKHSESGRKLIDAFRDNHKTEKGEGFSSPFEDLRPVPEELLIERSFGGEPDAQEQRNALYKANKEKYGFETWYEWRLANWGTKWDASDICIHEDEDTAMIRFDTAWCPPTQLLAWYAEQNPDVIFCNEYDEEGCSFEGYDLHSPDRGFQSESWEPKEAPCFEDLLDEIPETEK